MISVNPRYTVGETVRVTASFTNTDGTSVVPTSVSVTAKNPAGSISSYPVTNADGVLITDIVADLPGRWYVRLTCTQPTPAATEASFDVLASKV